MLFMGEEWAASTPWQYFTDFPDPDLGAAVSAGRKREFTAHGWRGEVPDPQDPATYERSKLDWAELDRSPHKDMLAWYGTLIALRSQEPDLADPGLDRAHAEYDEDAAWLVLHRGALRVVVNLADAAQDIPLDAPVDRVVVSSKRCYPTPGGLEVDALSVAIVAVAPPAR
jgi:maltooligosyltrehalose trehalohydrolase